MVIPYVSASPVPRAQPCGTASHSQALLTHTNKHTHSRSQRRQPRTAGVAQSADPPRRAADSWLGESHVAPSPFGLEVSVKRIITAPLPVLLPPPLPPRLLSSHRSASRSTRRLASSGLPARSLAWPPPRTPSGSAGVLRLLCRLIRTVEKCAKLSLITPGRARALPPCRPTVCKSPRCPPRPNRTSRTASLPPRHPRHRFSHVFRTAAPHRRRRRIATLLCVHAAAPLAPHARTLASRPQDASEASHARMSASAAPLHSAEHPPAGPPPRVRDCSPVCIQSFVCVAHGT